MGELIGFGPLQWTVEFALERNGRCKRYPFFFGPFYSHAELANWRMKFLEAINRLRPALSRNFSLYVPFQMISSCMIGIDDLLEFPIDPDLAAENFLFDYVSGSA